MESFISSSKTLMGTFDVVLSGGSPWGFTLLGGSEFRSKLIVSKITLGGKAHQLCQLKVGDEVLKVNGIDCTSRAEAIELVRCARDTLRLKVRRRTGDTGHQNGQIETQPKSSKPLPNFYATARELADSDFYSTYNVDPDAYKRVTHERPFSYHAHTHSDSLSGSSEDLLESYRKEVMRNPLTQKTIPPNIPRLSKSSTDLSNERVSPLAVEALSGVSLRESPVSPVGGRISPGRIMKVTVRTTTISGPSSPSGTNSNLSSPKSEVERERETNFVPRQMAGSGNNRKFDSQEKVAQDNWVERWLREDPRDHFHTTLPETFQQNFAVARSKFEQQGSGEQNRPSSVVEVNVGGQSNEELNALPRSKSFSGRTMYGVRGRERDTIPDASFSQPAAPLPPKRFSSSSLLHDRNVIPASSRHSSSASLPVEVKTSALVGQPVDVRLQRDLTQRLSGSTSSLDSVGTMDSSVSRSRQGPAPPPRRSQSKLLSSFRSKDKSFAAKYLAGVQGSTHDKPLQDSVVQPSEEYEQLAEPKHTASKSWPTQSDPDPPPGGDVVRQSWHAEPLVSKPRRSQRYSYEPQGSDRNYDMGPRFSSSVRIRALSTAGNVRPHPKIYRSVSQENSSQIDWHKERPHKFLMSLDRKTSQNMQPLSIEGTQILKKLLNDPSLPERMQDKSPSVKSRVQTFENKADSTLNVESGLHGRSKSFSLHDKENKSQTSGLRSALSTENLLEGKPSSGERIRPYERWASPRHDIRAERQRQSPPEVEQKQKCSPQRKFGTSSNEEPLNDNTGEKARIDGSETHNKYKKDDLLTSTLREDKESIFYSKNNFQMEERPFNDKFPPRGRHSVGSFNSVGSEINSKPKNRFESKSGRRVTVQPLVSPTSVGDTRSVKTPNNVSSRFGEIRAPDSSVVESRNVIDEIDGSSSVKEPSSTYKTPQSVLPPPVSEEIVANSSSLHTENDLDLGQQFLELDLSGFTKLNEKQSTDVLDTSLPLPPPPEVCEEESQWDNDEILPPPPPEVVFNSYEDNIPMPSPPVDVIPAKDKQEFAFGNSECEVIEVNDYPEKGYYESEVNVFRENEKNLAFSENEGDTSFDSILEKEKHLPKVNINEHKNMSSETDSEQQKKKFLNNSAEFENSSNDHGTYGSGENYASRSSVNEHNCSIDSPSNERHHPSDSTRQSIEKCSTPPPLLITSTPTKELQEEKEVDANSRSDDVSSPFSLGSDMSTPSNSRPNSMLSPKLEQLDKEKAELVESMKRKINELKAQQEEIADEIKANEELGEKITKVVESCTTTSQFSKYQLFTGELNKIIGLLLSLTQRMHRYELTLQDLDMSEESDRIQRDVLLEKIEKVKNQYEEACMIKEVNDKRGEVVSKFLEQYCTEEQFADFQYYIDMKTQLALMHAEIRDKVKMGTERLNALSQTAIDWSIMS